MKSKYIFIVLMLTSFQSNIVAINVSNEVLNERYIDAIVSNAITPPDWILGIWAKAIIPSKPNQKLGYIFTPDNFQILNSHPTTAIGFDYKNLIKSIEEELQTNCIVTQVIEDDFYSIKIDYKHPQAPAVILSLLPKISFVRGDFSVNKSIKLLSGTNRVKGLEFPKLDSL